MSNIYIVIDENDTEYMETCTLKEARAMAKRISAEQNADIWVIAWGRDVEKALYSNGKKVF